MRKSHIHILSCHRDYLCNKPSQYWLCRANFLIPVTKGSKGITQRSRKNPVQETVQIFTNKTKEYDRTSIGALDFVKHLTALIFCYTHAIITLTLECKKSFKVIKRILGFLKRMFLNVCFKSCLLQSENLWRYDFLEIKVFTFG